MSAVNRRRAALVGVAGVSMAAAGYMAPGAFAANTVDGDVTISNTETVQVLMDASGKIDAQRIYEQLVLRGTGNVDISNPVSTEGLRNLDGFGGFTVREDTMRVKTDVDGVKRLRSVSDYTKDLPVDVSVSYTLDGKKVQPGDVVGKSGDLEVLYEVVNTTGVQQDVTFPDGKGVEQSRANSVVIPMVGSLTTTLPSNFTQVKSAEANAAGDGRGGTQLSFTMTLFPPIGSDRASFGYTSRISGGVIPSASISMLPINPLESPSFKGGAASYLGGAESGADLTAGAITIDENLLKIRDGASELVAGIFQLKDGADQLSAGLNGTAVPGAQKLAAGAGDLDAGASKLKGGTGDLKSGAGQLDAGAGDLSDGLTSAKAGGPQLLDGVAQLTAGAQKVDAGLTKLQGDVNAGVGSPTVGDTSTLRGGVATVTYGISNDLVAGINDALGGLQSVKALVTASEATAPQKGQINGTLDAVISGLNGGKGKINAQLLPGLNNIDAGLAGLNSKVAAGVGTPGPSETLRGGTSQIIAGLAQLQDKGGELVDGLNQLSAGANRLKAGTGDLTDGAKRLDSGAGDLKDGTTRLADGAGQLSSGLGDAADGSAQLADGLGQAAASAPDLPDGAQKLSDEGTSQLINVGDATASEFGLKYALIEAGAARAATAQPYGSPEGATALTAFKFELAGEEGAGSANAKRAAAAALLLSAAGGLAAVRRRVLI